MYGVNVVLNGRTESKLQNVYSNIVKQGGSASIYVCDASLDEN